MNTFIRNRKYITSKKSVLLLIAMLVVIGGLAFTTRPALAATCVQYHTVQPGETLYRIGLKYGLTWDKLVAMNNITNPGLIYWGTVLCVAESGGTTPSPQPVPSAITTFTIVSVVQDSSVTIQTANFPANDIYNVLMGPMGTQGINGINVGTTDSGSGGSFTVTYTVPDALKGSYRIAIRLQSQYSGNYAYNWFYNNTSGGGTGGPVTPSPAPGGTIPTFSISSVVRDQTVTINTANLPANDTYNVLMGAMGTRGVNGILVDTIGSGSGGTFTLTFNIPAALYGSYQIAIRLQSPYSGNYGYNWFYNNTTP